MHTYSVQILANMESNSRGVERNQKTEMGEEHDMNMETDD